MQVKRHNSIKGLGSGLILGLGLGVGLQNELLNQLRKKELFNAHAHTMQNAEMNRRCKMKQ